MRKLIIPILVTLIGISMLVVGTLYLTVLRPSGEISAKTPESAKGNFVVTRPGVLELNAETAHISVEGPGELTVTIGRSTDVSGWVAGLKYSEIVGMQSDTVLAIEEHDGQDIDKPAEKPAEEDKDKKDTDKPQGLDEAELAKALAPANADTWEVVKTGKGKVEFDWPQKYGYWSLMAFSKDGTPQVTIMWKTPVSLGWVKALLISGAIVTLLGIALAIWLVLRGRKQRKADQDTPSDETQQDVYALDVPAGEAQVYDVPVDYALANDGSAYDVTALNDTSRGIEGLSEGVSPDSFQETNVEMDPSAAPLDEKALKKAQKKAARQAKKEERARRKAEKKASKMQALQVNDPPGGVTQPEGDELGAQPADMGAVAGVTTAGAGAVGAMGTGVEPGVGAAAYADAATGTDTLPGFDFENTVIPDDYTIPESYDSGVSEFTERTPIAEREIDVSLTPSTQDYATGNIPSRRALREARSRGEATIQMGNKTFSTGLTPAIDSAEAPTFDAPQAPQDVAPYVGADSSYSPAQVSGGYDPDFEYSGFASAPDYSAVQPPEPTVPGEPTQYPSDSSYDVSSFDTGVSYGDYVGSYAHVDTGSGYTDTSYSDTSTASAFSTSDFGGADSDNLDLDSSLFDTGIDDVHSSNDNYLSYSDSGETQAGSQDLYDVFDPTQDSAAVSSSYFESAQDDVYSGSISQESGYTEVYNTVQDGAYDDVYEPTQGAAYRATEPYDQPSAPAPEPDESYGSLFSTGFDNEAPSVYGDPLARNSFTASNDGSGTYADASSVSSDGTYAGPATQYVDPAVQYAGTETAYTSTGAQYTDPAAQYADSSAQYTDTGTDTSESEYRHSETTDFTQSSDNPYGGMPLDESLFGTGSNSVSPHSPYGDVNIGDDDSSFRTYNAHLFNTKDEN